MSKLLASYAPKDFPTNLALDEKAILRFKYHGKMRQGRITQESQNGGSIKVEVMESGIPEKWFRLGKIQSDIQIVDEEIHYN